MEGIIFDIKRFAVHDGPGIRTTLFFKGCPLNCWWCHNPESISKDIFIDKQNNVAIGKIYSPQSLLKEAEKDTVFFDESDGGITLSGGEPLLQYEFALETAKLLKQKGFHVALDTTGFTSEKRIKEIAQHIDLFLFDLKHIDDALHSKFTGVSNVLILKNLKILDALKKEIRIRIPLIPKINNNQKHLKQIIEFLNTLENIYPIDILPYHKIANHKYQKFYIENKMTDADELSDKEINDVKKMFVDKGFEVTVGG